ncbi:hypothetical protein BIW11_04717 [Tropilaelaps mercedesae]|uniref:Uncharacterized protein n=1 Tax=Tropilaelaps mercedesae TaxID=418985 RepID=A0A1V9X2G2_9ACAR|nr:hypothetical protein BIW11_04717 [Tropilaelaps mercedesae]
MITQMVEIIEILSVENLVGRTALL